MIKSVNREMKHFCSILLFFIFLIVDVTSRIARRKRFVFFFINITLVPKNNPFLTFTNPASIKAVKPQTTSVPATVPPKSSSVSPTPQPTMSPAVSIEPTTNAPTEASPTPPLETTPAEVPPPSSTPASNSSEITQAPTTAASETSNEGTTIPGSVMSSNTSAQISKLNGWEPEWSNDGAEITFVSPNVKITRQSQPLRRSNTQPKYSTPSQFTPCLRTNRSGKLVKALCFKISV